jgi:cobalt-zinc-cadmium efflux system membrane fusion protein
MGRESIVAAPLAGRLKTPMSEMPRPGQKVKRGEVLFNLEPILGADARTTLAASAIEAEGQVKTEEKKVAAALIALNRAERLHKEEAGSQRAVDEARATHQVAEKSFEAAQARRDLLKKALGDFETGAVAPLPIKAPADGVLRAVPVREGQVVASGTTLFDVASLDRVWVRVPIYVGDEYSIDSTRAVGVNSLSQWGRPSRVRAEPVKDPPPAASALGVTIDLFYEMKNPNGHFRPGQRVAVTLPLNGEEEALVVPWSAIEFDIHGGTWVYEKQQAHTYVRRRVRVLHVIGNEAVLATGPVAGEHILVANDKPVEAGMNVVITGVAELFGSELGLGLNIGGKGKVEDDDD